MRVSIPEKLRNNPRDLVFAALICLCMVLGAGAVKMGLEQRAASMAAVGGRKVDLPSVRKQISEGVLSERKALYFRKVPR